MRGSVNLWLSGVVASAASMLGFSLLYLAARRGGRALLWRMAPRLHFNPNNLDRIEQWVERRGTVIIFLARLIPGLRLPSVLVSGVLAIPFHIFFLYASLAAVLRVAAFLYLGAAATHVRFPQVRLAAIQGRYLLGALALVLLALWLTVRWRRLRRENGNGGVSC